MAQKTYLIGIAGPSGAGKSFLAEHLGRALKSSVLSLDHYYRDLSHLPLQARAQSNFDAPAAIQEDLLISQVRELVEGLPVEVPIYDFEQHARTRQTLQLLPARHVIVEGLFTLYWPELRKLLGTGVYVEADEDVCLGRRIHRDVRQRGRTEESVLEQVRVSVAPMMHLYVQPTRSYADVVLSGSANVDENVKQVLQHVRAGIQQRQNTMVAK